MGQLSRLAAMPLVLAALAGCNGPPLAPAPPVARTACLAPAPVPDPHHPREGMIRLAAARFEMGAAPLRPEEGPPRRVRVGAFWIDRTEVTNAAFARFVAATGYRTLAERGLDPAQYPNLTPDQRRPASLVFVGAQSRSRNSGDWWRIVPGADWRHPAGPGSSLAGLDQRPVVHVAWEDAMAYARWLGRDLPTEAEWEYAARGGLAGARYTWGDSHDAAGRRQANTWQGVFPAVDSGDDGYPARTAPVGCFRSNGYGLFDMAGNVWEWTRDWYHPGLEDASTLEQGGPPRGRSSDPNEPGVPKHVIKGGSYLCADDYCYRYRPAARTPGPPDSGASHVGFRTVLRESAAAGG